MEGALQGANRNDIKDISALVALYGGRAMAALLLGSVKLVTPEKANR